MKKLLVVLAVACALALPATAHGGVIDDRPKSIYRTAAIGRWANLQTGVFWTFPTSTTLKVNTINASVTSTHYGVHVLMKCRVQITSGTKTVYDKTCDVHHFITDMDTVTDTFYPSVTCSTSATNKEGTMVRYIANFDAPKIGDDITTPFYWTGNFLR
jgi:hypothetical protein